MKTVAKKETTKRSRVVLNINDADFIRTWQSSDDVPHVARVHGITLEQAHRRAMQLRKHKVGLKQMTRGKHKDWATLVELAKQCEIQGQ